MSPTLFLCVDCGGTKTAAAISDAHGNIVGNGSGGPSNITYLTVDDFIESVRTAVLGALESARPDVEQLPSKDPLFVAAWLGISGADSPAAIAKVTPALSALLAVPVGPNLVIANDTHLLAAPVRLHSDASHVVAVIAGTGSIAVSFAKEGGRMIRELGRVGGWGWILGDEGGGYDVGREAIRQLLIEEDLASIRGTPSPPSNLRDQVLARFNVTSVMEILGEIYCADPKSTDDSGEGLRALPREKRISSLPPLVFSTAFEQDDWLAQRILHNAANHLVGQVAQLLGDCGGVAEGRIIKAKDCVISFGGSLVGAEKYRRIILDQLAEKGHTFPYVHFIDNAATTGATSLASTFK